MEKIKRTYDVSFKKKRPYFVSKEAYVVSKDYLNRDFKALQPNGK
ncbi:hypothetical protein QUF99_18905 [Bacillus sp. DX4.1]|nr:hypothetical protein [Bacillus sp. DX4.1]MDM5189296.1 hypothetical protein [Bacillus sp. DX4.1]